MNKKVIKIFDQEFAHESYCGSKIGKNESKNIIWDRSRQINEGDIVFFTDSLLSMVDSVSVNCKKVAWLIEPPEVNSSSYDYIRNNWQKFDLVLTHQESLLCLSDRIKILPMWCSWVSPQNQKITEKIKLISIISSNKRDTIGQKLRHEIIDAIKSDIDLDIFGGLTSGGGYKPIDDKSEGLSPYMFSIIIENAKSPYLFTEKIIDCLLTGTVPIYWGASKIGEFFNMKGFITFNNLDDVQNIVNEISEEKYKEMMPYLLENFNTAKQYLTIEDYFYEKYIKN